MALAPGILIGWIYYRSVFFFSFAPWSEQVRDHRTASLVAPGNVFRGDAVAQNRTCKKKKRCVMRKLVLKGLMVSDTAPLPRAHPSPILRPVIHMTELNLTSNAGPCGLAFISAASSQRRCDHRRLFGGRHTLPRNRCETVLSALGGSSSSSSSVVGTHVFKNLLVLKAPCIAKKSIHGNLCFMAT